MPFNVLLLPLLGGYIFITKWNKTRFDAKRYSGERLIFHAAIAGVAFLIAAYLITRALHASAPDLYKLWSSAVPFPNTAAPLVAFVMGTTLWWPLNKWKHDRSTEIQAAIEEYNDYLEILLKRALDETRYVAITLKNGKVYVGFVVRSFDPAYDRKYLVLLPAISGFRDDRTHQLTFTTDYTRVYQELENSPADASVTDDFELVLPVSEVLSASYFDGNVYRRFNPAPVAA